MPCGLEITSFVRLYLHFFASILFFFLNAQGPTEYITVWPLDGTETDITILDKNKLVGYYYER